MVCGVCGDCWSVCLFVSWFVGGVRVFVGVLGCLFVCLFGLGLFGFFGGVPQSVGWTSFNVYWVLLLLSNYKNLRLS